MVIAARLSGPSRNPPHEDTACTLQLTWQQPPYRWYVHAQQSSTSR